MVTVIKGNKREVPEGVPIMAWWEQVQEYRAQVQWADVPWYSYEMEYLTPDELKTIRAKALTWYDIYGEWPTDISCWWEVRMARRRGDLPLSEEYVVCHLNDEGSLVCGYCEARWGQNKDGSDWPNACKLCGYRWIKPERLSEEVLK